MRRIFLLFLVFSYFCLNSQNSDTLLIKEHLKVITKTNGFRNYLNTELLNKTADYIYSVFSIYADTVYFQVYQAKGNIYKNVVCRFGKNDNPLIVVGAHYDVCGNQEGADDNASGVVALLEIARMLHNKDLEYPVELVAYSLEEPPFFRTEQMGSYIHAKSLNDSETKVYGMLAIEMIGYFSDEKGSQAYPFKPQKIIFGSTGDYILLAKKTGPGVFVRNFSKNFYKHADIPSRSKKSPAKLMAIDFSDHLNYWKFGYDALMVTNTAFYRNPNYHRSGDTMETLDILRMSKVIDALYSAILTSAN